VTNLEPASALADRIAEDCYQPVDNWDSGDASSFDREKCAELIESDRSAVREATLREALDALRVALRAWGEDELSRLIADDIEGSLEKLLTEKGTT
jgi:hypothetical protein